MSGHSKWATIKHKKGAADQKRGRVFTKLIKEITIAARQGGGDVAMNPRLRTAVATAKANNMPSDNVTRAIKKGTGELEGVSYEEINFEGYGPGGAAIMVECVSDNRNRCVSEIRHAFTKYNGNLGEQGCVGWMFDRKGVFTFSKDDVTEEKLMEIALEAGADDIKDDGSYWQVFTSPAEFENVRQALKAANLVDAEATISMVPQNTVQLVGKDVQTMLKLMDALEELDDVQKTFANFDISEEEMEKLSA